MGVPKNIKEMIGHEYLFSGTVIDGNDRKDELFEVIDARMSDYTVSNSDSKIKHPCFELLVTNGNIETWTKPFPLRNINSKLNVV
jgi:hypothetical protein